MDFLSNDVKFTYECRSNLSVLNIQSIWSFFYQKGNQIILQTFGCSKETYFSKGKSYHCKQICFSLSLECEQVPVSGSGETR